MEIELPTTDIETRGCTHVGVGPHLTFLTPGPPHRLRRGIIIQPNLQVDINSISVQIIFSMHIFNASISVF